MLRKHLLATCAATAFLIGMPTLSSVSAAELENSHAFTIAAQPLEEALLAFSNQSGVQVVASGDMVAGKNTSGFYNTASAKEALDALLTGTSLTYKVQGAGTVAIIEQVADSQGTDSGAEETSFMLEEIIVTATRREASMQDVPMSITAFNGDRIKESGVQDIGDLQFLAAGLQVNIENGRGFVALRGVGSDAVNVGAESGIAMHLDGVYIAQQHQIPVGFFDVERIEVLRGPQGTLYGRNATGGAINVISKSPTREFEAGGNITIGNYNLIETEGFVSGPLIGDKLMTRVAFKTRDHDGYTLNIFNDERLDNDNVGAVRGILRYEPTTNFRFDITADFARDNDMSATFIERGPAGAPLPFEVEGGVLPSGRAVNQNNDTLSETEVFGVAAKVVWDLETMTFSSLSAYRKSSQLFKLDEDGGNTSLSWFPGEENDAKQFSQELTLSSPGEGKLQWIVGGYYFHTTVTQFGDVFVPLLLNYSADDYEADAYAAFGEVSYPVLDRLTLTLGARYSYEKKSIAGALIIPDFNSVDFQALEDDWGSFTPKAALTYEFSDTVVAYATIGKGFKAGGYNGGFGKAANPLGAYDPEEVVNYEIGLKTTFFNGRLRANIALFHMDYTEMQVYAIKTNQATGLSLTAVQNAASSTIRGVELELQAQPTEHLSFDVNTSYLDATFGDWPDATKNTAPDEAFDVTGNRVLNTPKWAVNLGATYTVSVGDWGVANLHGEYAYKSRVFFDPFENPLSSQKGVGLVNARLSFEDSDGKWTIAGWVKNLTDETVASTRGPSLSDGVERITSVLRPPRTYGITVGYRF